MRTNSSILYRDCSRGLNQIMEEAVKNFFMAIIVIDGLVDFRFMNTFPSEFKKSKDYKKGNS